MFTRLLTELERKRLRDYLERGEIPSTLRLMISRIRKSQPQIREDMKLMQDALQRYESNRRR
jgi:hypothetical protein